MSLEVETANKGTVGGFGFFSPDMHRIGMGEMPAMPIDQFAPFAVDTILAALPTLTGKQVENIRYMVALGMDTVEKSAIRVRKMDSSSDLPKNVHVMDYTPIKKLDADGATIYVNQVPSSALDNIFQAKTPKEKGIASESFRKALADSMGAKVKVYEQNPFEISADGTIAITPDYAGIDIIGFAGLTVHVLRGGWTGWDDDLGIPEAAYRNLERLEGALAKI